MNGNGNDRTGRERSQALVRGVLDFELDIGIVGDVDPDPLKFGRKGSSGRGGSSIRDLTFSASMDDEDTTAADILENRAFSLATDGWLSIQGGEHGQSLFIGSQRVELPKEWKNPDFPFVRGMPDGTILISDTTFEVSHEKNTWILSRKGEVLAHFGVGSAAVEISPLEGGLIAVAYHPMSARRFGHRVEPQQRTAIAFFDRQGKLLTTFNHEAGRSNIAAENVRCMTRISPVELVFIPEKLTNRGQEVENPVVFYHCATGRTVVFSAPFGGAEAISVARGQTGESWLLLASPEGFEDQVIAFDPARKMSQYLGAFNGIFRGLANDAVGGLSGGLLSGGFLAQEVVSEYNWVLTDSSALPTTFTTPTADRRDEDESEDEEDEIQKSPKSSRDGDGPDL
ncbi:hypothetical protein BH10BDE1_BH10BDE1_13160 [soil metagenome]